jgi:hypothetical protein
MSFVRQASSFVVVLVLVSSAPAIAKGPAPFRVFTPSGNSFVVSGEKARVWWEDLWANPNPPDQPFPCCKSPGAAGHYAGTVWAQWGKRAAEIPEPYVIHSGWTGLFYPSTTEAPAYIVMPLAQGGNGRRWPMWRVATQRMEDIILSGAREANKDATPSTGNDGGIPTTLWVTGGALLLLVAMIVIRRLTSMESQPIT